MAEGVLLPFDWQANERGNTWLLDGDGDCQASWFDLPGEPLRRLEVTTAIPNGPGHYVSVLSPERSADSWLSAHITVRCNGWVIRRCNVEGVVANGTVVGTPEGEALVTMLVAMAEFKKKSAQQLISHFSLRPDSYHNGGVREVCHGLVFQEEEDPDFLLQELYNMETSISDDVYHPPV